MPQLLRRAIDLAIKPPPIVLRPAMRLAEVIPKMKELRIRTAPVVDERESLLGVLTYRTVLMRGVGRDTKVRTVMDPPFSIRYDLPVEVSASRFVEWKLKEVPVTDERGAVVGLLTRQGLLEYMVENNMIPPEPVEKVMSSPPVMVGEEESVARARWLMLRSGVSRLPVVNRDNRVVGVITLSDIVERLYAIRMSRRRGLEWVESEESLLAAPVSEYMTAPPITVPVGTTLSKVAEILLSNSISGVPVVTGDDKVVGVISGLDLIRRFVESKVEVRPLTTKIRDVIGSEALKLQLEKLMNDYLSKLSRYVNIVDFKFTVKPARKGEGHQGREGRRQYAVSVRLATDEGSFSVKAACWDLLTCVREALETLEKRVRKELEKRMYVRRGGKRVE